MVTTYALKHDAINASSALRVALHTAGIGCLGPDMEDEEDDGRPVMSVHYLTGAGAVTFAALLRAGLTRSSAETTVLAPPSFLDRLGHEETVVAHDELAEVLARLTITGLTPVTEHPRGGAPVMHLLNLGAADATRLAALLNEGMHEYVACADALNSAFQAGGLDVYGPVPVPSVEGLRIRLGDISVPGAAALGTLLGASPFPTPLDDVPDYPEGVRVMNRLHEAVKAGTEGGFMDLELHPSCVKCGHLPTITLGTLDLATAERLAAALRPRHNTADEEPTS